MRIAAMTTVLCAAAVITASADTLMPVAVWGSPSGTPAAFDAPVSVSVARSGEVFVADVAQHQIIWLSSTGAFLNACGGIAPLSEDPPGLSTNGPYMFDANRRLVYRADVSPTSPQRIEICVLFDPRAIYVRGIAVAGDNDEYPFLSNGVNGRITRYDRGVPAFDFGGPGTGPGQFGDLGPLVSDGKDQLYVIDAGNDRVQAFTSGGSYLFEWGSHGSGPGQFDFSRGGGIDLDAAGYVWVVERANRRIQKFATRFTPTTSTTWGAIKARWRSGGAGTERY